MRTMEAVRLRKALRDLVVAAELQRQPLTADSPSGQLAKLPSGERVDRYAYLTEKVAAARALIDSPLDVLDAFLDGPFWDQDTGGCHFCVGEESEEGTHEPLCPVSRARAIRLRLGPFRKE